jgi:hypothetical protein
VPAELWVTPRKALSPGTHLGQWPILEPFAAHNGGLEVAGALGGSGEGKLLLVVLDRAGWHVSGRVEVPEGVGLVFLPPYSPELQPVERVWPLVDAVVANGRVDTEGELWEGGGALGEGRGPLCLPADPAGPDSEPYPLPLVAGRMLREWIRGISYHKGQRVD